VSETAKSVRQRVLDAIQSGFPLDHDPYGVLAGRLGMTREQVRGLVASLREDGTVRRIGASFSSRHLGYTSTLCAMTVPGAPSEVDRIAAKVSAHAEVTHNYLRDGAFNVWFTVIAPSEAAIGRLLDDMRHETGCEIMSFPATEVFKIKVDFSGTADQKPEPVGESSFRANDANDLALLRKVQGDIGEAAYPFAELGMNEEQALDRLREWKAEGTIRRFGAFVRHRKMGFAFNGMTVWDVPECDCQRVGRSFADFPFVSHCYERPRCEAWPYNLYAMVHGKTKPQLEAHVASLREASGLSCEVLVSLKEYKKVSPVYFG